MIILGIDPGTTRIGYGVIEKKNGKLFHVQSGIFNLPPLSLAERLLVLDRELQGLITSYRPRIAGVEKIYFSSNQKTAIDVAQARGVILLVFSFSSLPFFELTPLEVKLAVAGSGRASKQAVARMVGHFLQISGTGKLDDVTDALAVAIAISHHAPPSHV